ncbi:MAG: VOC family protein [Amphiplicatus sp.]
MRRPRKRTPRLDHLSLAVTDCRRSSSWYVDNLGFAVEFEAAQGGRESLGVIALQDEGGFTVFLEQISGPIFSGQAAYTIKVEDVDALWARLSSAGIAFLSSPRKQFWGYGAVLADPDGHLLYLYDEESMRRKG